MMKQLTASLLCITLLFVYLVPYAGPAVAPDLPEVAVPVLTGNVIHQYQSSNSTSDIFSENLGQIDNADVRFYSASGSIAFMQNSVIIYSQEKSKSQQNMADQKLSPELIRENLTRNVMVFSFVNSNNIQPTGTDPTPWQTNYLFGSNAESWHTGVPNYRGVMYADIWDGIDLVYQLRDGAIKYDFILHPGANPHDIKIQVSGHESISVKENGDLCIDTGLGPGSEIVDSGLVAFYADDETKKIPAIFAITGPDTYTFMLGDMDSSRTIIIDPLIYSTFLGGSDYDYCTDVSTGNDGCAYVTGYTDSPDFMTTPGVYDRVYDGYTYDIFVAKMGLHGDSLVYSTLFGDDGLDSSNSIAVDGAGCAYITGYTNSVNFPTTPNAYDRTYNGGTYDSFVTKLSPMGDSLIYSTFLGGERVEYGKGICVDDEGYAYVTGEAYPTPPPGPPEFRSQTPQPSISSFPTTSGAFQWGSGLSDIFVTKFDQAGSELVYSTHFGTSEPETSNAIAVDGNGYAYITGYTKSSQYPTTTNAFDRTYGGSRDAFVTKLTPTGSSLAYSTFLGGSSGDAGNDIAVGQWGHAYVTGSTQSPEYPTTSDAFDTTHNGWRDGFVTILSKYGDKLTSSTFLGGTGSEYGTGITIDSAGYALVTGITNSNNFPVTDNAMDPIYNDNSDAFVAKLPISGNYLFYSSYLGGADADIGTGIVFSQTGFTYVVGSTSSPDYSNTTGAFDITFNGDMDAFITKLDLEMPYTDAGPDQRVNEGNLVNFDASKSTDNTAIVNYTWTFYDGFSNITVYDVAPAHTFYIPGDYLVNLKVWDETGNWATDTMSLTILDITCPIAHAGQDQWIDEDTNISFDGSESSDNVGIVNYSWSFVHDEEEIVLYGDQTEFNFTEPGIYAVLLIALDAAGNAGEDELTISVNDITRPVANAGDDVRIFNNKIITLDGTASRDNVEIVNYTWKLDGNNEIVLLYGARLAYLFDGIGLYTATLNVTDAAGLYDSDSIIITVLETEKPVAEAGTDLTAEENQPMTFDGTASADNVGVHEWLWSFDDGLNDVVITGSEPTWIFPLAGTYAVTLNASDEAGNWDTDTVSVTVIDATPPDVLAGHNQISEIGQEVSLNGNGTTDNSGIADYTWTLRHNDTDITLHGSSPTFKFWTSGTYTITLTATDSVGNSASSTVDITILPQAVSQQEIPTTDNSGWIMIIASVFITLLGAVLLLLRKRREQ